MLFQACRFVRSAPKSGMKADAKWESGIAKVHNFDVYTIDFIITESGEKLQSVHNYSLIHGPASHIAMNEKLDF